MGVARGSRRAYGSSFKAFIVIVIVVTRVQPTQAACGLLKRVASSFTQAIHAHPIKYLHDPNTQVNWSSLQDFKKVVNGACIYLASRHSTLTNSIHCTAANPHHNAQVLMESLSACFSPVVVPNL
jgi:hypothetical protein